MSTRKIRDLPPEKRCLHPEHEPPSHRWYENGVYEHECPACGRKIEFTINRPTSCIRFLNRAVQ